MLIKFVKRASHGFFEALLWLTLIGCVIGGVIGGIVLMEGAGEALLG